MWIGEIVPDTGVCALVAGEQVAVFRLADDTLHAVGNVDPESGAVYLVTDYLGVDLNRPGGIGTLVQTPIQGSFQVLKVAN